MTSRLTMTVAAAALFAGPAFAQDQGSEQTREETAAAESGQSGSTDTRVDMPESADVQTPDRDRDDYMTGEENTAATDPGGRETARTSAEGRSAGRNGMSASERDQIMAASQQEVRDLLSEAGFSDVRIRSAAYLVAATSPDGDSVMMVVDTERMARQRRESGQMGADGGAPRSQ